MQIIEPKVIVNKLDLENAERKLKLLEHAGRVCYKSEGNSTEDSYLTFLNDKIKLGHESILEHEKITVKFIVDRGVSHEIVRHRIAAYSQESTRYCNYSKDRFGNEITLIRPFFFEKGTHEYEVWKEACSYVEKRYIWLLNHGRSAQEARSILPNSLKTEIVVTYNMREWRHFFKLRTAKVAHPQMRQVAVPLFFYLKEKFEPLFNDLTINLDFILPYEYPILAEVVEEDFV